jgi:hypothetical protein
MVASQAMRAPGIRRMPQLWFLLVSGFALIQLVPTAKEMLRESEFVYHGVQTLGWVTGIQGGSGSVKLSIMHIGSTRKRIAASMD